MAINRADELPIRLGARIADPADTGCCDLPSDILSRCLALASDILSRCLDLSIRHIDTAPYAYGSAKKGREERRRDGGDPTTLRGQVVARNGRLLNGHGLKCRAHPGRKRRGTCLATLSSPLPRSPKTSAFVEEE